MFSQSLKYVFISFLVLTLSACQESSDSNEKSTDTSSNTTNSTGNSSGTSGTSGNTGGSTSGSTTTKTSLLKRTYNKGGSATFVEFVTNGSAIAAVSNIGLNAAFSDDLVGTFNLGTGFSEPVAIDTSSKNLYYGNNNSYTWNKMYDTDMTSNGDVVMAWAQPTNRFQADVLASIWTSSNQTASTPATLHNDTTHEIYFPRVTAWRDGATTKAVAVWKRKAATTSTVEYSYFDGTNWSTKQTVSSLCAGCTSFMAHDVGLIGGDQTVQMIVDGTGDSKHKVFASTFDKTNATWSTPAIISLDASGEKDFKCANPDGYLGNSLTVAESPDRKTAVVGVFFKNSSSCETAQQSDASIWAIRYENNTWQKVEQLGTIEHNNQTGKRNTTSWLQFSLNNEGNILAAYGKPLVAQFFDASSDTWDNGTLFDSANSGSISDTVQVGTALDSSKGIVVGVTSVSLITDPNKAEYRWFDLTTKTFGPITELDLSGQTTNIQAIMNGSKALVGAATFDTPNRDKSTLEIFELDDK